MNALDLAARVVSSLRDDERARPYRLERNPAMTIPDTTRWLSDVAWVEPRGTGAEREQTACRLQFGRWRLRHEYRERGGR